MFAQGGDSEDDHDREENTEANTETTAGCDLFDGAFTLGAVDGRSVGEEGNIVRAEDKPAI